MELLMEIEEIGKNLKQKIEELETIEKWYAGESDKIQAWYKSKGKAIETWFKKETKEIKKWQDDISKATRVELSQKKMRLEKLDVKNLPRNKDSSISQRSNAGKEAVQLIEQIPKLEAQTEAWLIDESVKEKKLQNEYQQKIAPLDEEKKNKENTLLKNKEDRTARLPGEIEKMLKQCFNHYSEDEATSEKVKQKYINEKAFKEFDQLFTNLKKTPNQEIVSSEKTVKILNAYFVLCKRQDFKIVFPNKNTFFNLLYRNEYISVKRRTHYMRYYLFYIWVPLLFWVAFTQSEQADFNQTLGFIAFLLSFPWPLTFIYSFFYKKEKRKVYKLNHDAFTSIKSDLDRHLSDFVKSIMLSKINQVVGTKCDKFIEEIYMGI
jgi:hypothetical protein